MNRKQRILMFGKEIGIIRKRPVWLGIVFVAGIAANLAFFALSFWPAFQLRYELSGEQSVLEAQKQQMEKTPVPQKITQEDINRMLSQVPEEDRHGDFLLMLNRLEAESGIVITKLSIGERTTGTDELTVAKEMGKSGASGSKEENDGKRIQAQPVELQITGNYPQIAAFLEKLHHVERLVDVQEWQMSAIEKTGDEQKLQMTLNLRIFTAKPYAGQASEEDGS